MAISNTTTDHPEWTAYINTLRHSTIAIVAGIAILKQGKEPSDGLKELVAKLNEKAGEQRKAYNDAFGNREGPYRVTDLVDPVEVLGRRRRRRRRFEGAGVRHG